MDALSILHFFHGGSLANHSIVEKNPALIKGKSECRGGARRNVLGIGRNEEARGWAAFRTRTSRLPSQAFVPFAKRLEHCRRLPPLHLFLKTMAAAVLQAGSFVAALAANGIYSKRLADASRAASAIAVADGGANPSVWAFAIWGIIYALFGVAYVWYGASGRDWAALPVLLAVGWGLNIAWVVASTRSRWKLGLGIILAYLVCVCAVLPQLTAGDGATALLGGACGILAVWLCAASLLNLQIAVPAAANVVGMAAPVCVAAGAAGIIKLGSPETSSLSPQTFACLGAALWVLVALSDADPSKRLGDELDE